jgi:hypothetical protein
MHNRSTVLHNQSLSHITLDTSITQSRGKGVGGGGGGEKTFPKTRGGGGIPPQII